MRDGFERSSLDAIAADAEVSKVTIYRYFPSKESLFDAVIQAKTEAFELGAGMFAALSPQDVEGSLTKVARRFLGLMRDPGAVGMHRALFALGGQEQNPAGARFFAHGPQSLVDGLAGFLARARDSGGLTLPTSPERAADQFLSLFLGRHHIMALLGVAMPKPEEDEQLVAENVQFFLAACRPQR